MRCAAEVSGWAVVAGLQGWLAGAGRETATVPWRISAEAGLIGFDDRFLTRAMNVDLSGGEKKKNETLQLGVLRPAIALLDELDSGVDVDALRACARRIEAATHTPAAGGTGLGVLALSTAERSVGKERVGTR